MVATYKTIKRFLSVRLYRLCYRHVFAKYHADKAAGASSSINKIHGSLYLIPFVKSNNRNRMRYKVIYSAQR